MVNFRVDGRLVYTTLLTPPAHDYKVGDLYIFYPSGKLSRTVQLAIAFAVDNFVHSMTVDGVCINRE